jgi:hypothetical protein
MASWRFVRCESWPCGDYENDRDMWLYAMEIARDAAKGSKAKEQSEIIRIRAHRNGGAIAELHRQSMGIVGDKPVPYFLGMRCDIMKRQVKQFFAAWIKVK